MTKVYLTAFEHLLPPVKLEQNTLNRWVLEAHQRSAGLANVTADWEKLQKYFIPAEAIASRFSFVTDLDREWSDAEIYSLTAATPFGSDLLKRTQYFQRQAMACFRQLYPSTAQLPEHLIHVTCTGYVSPSAPQRVFAERETAVGITHAYHMGCYAAVPAVRLAHALVRSGECRSVDIVHTEMCSLHMAAHVHTAEQMIVQSLFADGVIRYQLTTQRPLQGFELLLVHECLVPDSAEDMSWIPSAQGMAMSLTRDVPTKIGLALGEFIKTVCAKVGMDWEELKAKSAFAIHPGGPKILELAATLLEAEVDQLRASREIFHERGNMSSATLPHIWERLLQTPTEREYVLSLAFGPGLTIIGCVLRRVRP